MTAMASSQVPVLKDLVLIGGGHSHITVLKRFGMRPLPGVRLTLICRDVHTPYSGMLPGLVAGHYEFDEAHIDLGKLAQFAGARFYHDEVTGIDVENRELHCRGRPSFHYDLLSVNTGSTPGLRVQGAEDRVIPVKPIHHFIERWEALQRRVLEATEVLTVGVVGGGAGGVEMTLSIQFALRALLQREGRPELLPEFELYSASDEILPTHNHKVQRTFRRILAERRVRVMTGRRVVEVRDKVLRLDGGAEHPVDEVLWVTDAEGPKWLRNSGIEHDQHGFLLVDDNLETSRPGIFAAGDVATMREHAREKAGVFAVRQGRPLEQNLRRRLLGESLRPYRPQEGYLALISTGNRYAVASRRWLTVRGRWVWRWKNWIDRRFMNKFSRDLPRMSSPPPSVPSSLGDEETLREISTIAMRCGGCGAKVGASVLSRVLATLEPHRRDDVLIGLDAPDDAAVSEIPAGNVLVQTVDSFRSFYDDAFVFGKIAANHSLGDVYAMGAEPQSALAVVTVPYGVETKVEETLRELLGGAVEVLNDAGAALVGGHTSEGAELSLGFSINGLIRREEILQKGGMQPGDRLLLTKPLGTGTLFAAHMRLFPKGRWIAKALDSMMQSNRQGAAVLRKFGASACTDVTGFGLLGHLVEMTKASGVDATVHLEALPLLEGAVDCVTAGFLSSLQPQNVRLRRAVHNLEATVQHPIYPLVFDPQTAGGLLAAVPKDSVGACLSELHEHGYAAAAVIGHVDERSNRAEPIRLLAES